MKKIFIIILHYKDYKNLRESIKRLTRLEKPWAKVETLIVDNESNVSSLHLSIKGFKNIHSISFKKNYGFSGGFNRGIKYAIKNGADYVLMTSPDLILEKDVLVKLFRTIEMDKKIGAACPKILIKSNNKRVFFVSGKLDERRKTSIHVGLNKIDKHQYDLINETDFLNCPTLVSKEAIKKSGYLNEDFFLYYEDIEWYTRFKQKGFKLACVKSAIAWNGDPQLDSSDNYRKAYYCSRNYLYFLVKNFPPISVGIGIFYELKEILHIFNKIVSNPKNIKNKIEYYKLLGIKDFLFGIKGYKNFNNL